jgi:hypothetical protein
MLKSDCHGRERKPRVFGAAKVAVTVLVLVAANLVGAVSPNAAQAAIPTTVSVVVSGDALQGLTLTPLNVAPTFAPDIHDYSVRCQAGVNLATLTLTATTNGSISISDPSSDASGHSVSLPETLVENQALVVQAPDPAQPSGPPVQYWVRCLPHDFPALHVDESGTAPPGWYLTGNLTTSATSATYAMILDEHGTPVWYQPAPGGAINTELLPNDTIAWAPALGPGFGANPNGAYTLYHLDTNSKSSVAAPVPPTDPHELLQLGNGDRMMIATPLRSGFDLSALGAAFATTNTIVDCVVEEIDPNGALVWQWRMSDHVGIDEALTTPRLLNAPSDVNGTSAADVYHCNSLEVDPSGNVLISSRHTSAVYLVDKTSGAIVWKMGGTGSNHDNAQILTIQNDPEGMFSGQHDARLHSNGDVSVYDDHTGATDAARGAEYAIDTNAGTATLVWQYAAPDGLPSAATGSFRRSADGNDNVIGWGFKAGGYGFTEVDAAGNVLLNVTFPNGEVTYRAVKEPTAAIDAEVLRRSVPPPTAPVSRWESLGGTLTSAPAVASQGNGLLDVFVRGTTDQLHYKSYNHGAWSRWESLGGALTSAPAVASQGNGLLDVFARGTNNQLYHLSYNHGRWSRWESLGGTLTSAPAATSQGNGLLDVFARGTTGQLHYKSYNHGAWSRWESLGGTLTSAPAVASQGNGLLDVFVRGTDGSAYQKSYNHGAWGHWERLGGTLTSAPAAASQGNGLLDVFVRGTDGSAYQKSYKNGTWSSWQRMGVLASGDMAVASWSPHRLDLLVRDVDVGLGHRWFTGTGWLP